MASKTLDKWLDLADEQEKMPFSKIVQAEPHTAVYTMHKFWARRPHNVFAELVKHYSEPGDVILDPFCGGGVTVVEALHLRRRVVGVDLNPLATYVTEMEVRALNVENFLREFKKMDIKVGRDLLKLYRTTCPNCGGGDAYFDWLEWSDGDPGKMKYICPRCGSDEKIAGEEDYNLAKTVEENFERITLEKQLWYPRAAIPIGDKTEGIIRDGYTHFWQLFTRRNLLALSILHKEILNVEDPNIRDFLRFAFSSSLKWASKQSHLRRNIVEGWAMHAYWLYPKTLEINVWNTFTRRCQAVSRGKRYSNEHIGNYFRKAESFEDLLNNNGTCLILTQSSTNLPLPDEKVDVVITDPPFGGNVNYGELADYWMVWKNQDSIIDKTQEVIINKNQKKGLDDYEKGLKSVFDECFRVLKKGSNMVVTFNSRNLGVVASFIIASSRAGFVLHPEGLLYQPPIRAYTTTFHAMQIGAFTGDFIFTFSKPTQINLDARSAENYLRNFREHIDSLVENHLGERITEPELREQVYKTLIPFLGFHARSNLQVCREAVDYFELKMRKLEPYFKELRKQIIEERRGSIYQPS